MARISGALATSQEQAVTGLRQMILSGALPPGRRVTEAALTQALSTSRTPVRYALMALSQEGLLTGVGKRGYVVSSFQIDDVLGAVDVRAVLEGLAARKIAEAGLCAPLRASLFACLDDGDALFAKGHLVAGDAARYADMNRRFHDLITDGSGNGALADLLAFNQRVPFAAAGAFAFEHADLPAQYKALNFAHLQHHAIVQALEQGDGTRVEALMREHAQAVKHSLHREGEALFAQGAAIMGEGP